LVFDYAVSTAKQDRRFRQIVADIIRANANQSLVKKLKKEFAGDPNAPSIFGAGYVLSNGQLIGDDPPEASFCRKHTVADVQLKVDNWYSRAQRAVQTSDRRKLLDEIYKSMPPMLTTTQAVTMLKTFSRIAGRCHPSTMKSWSSAYKWLGMTNHCIAQIHCNDNLTWPEMCHTHALSGCCIFEKFSDCGLGSKILTPNKRVKQVVGQPAPNPLLGKKFPKPASGAPAVGKTCPSCNQSVGCRTKWCKCGHKFY
jgi:hypothetical protein